MTSEPNSDDVAAGVVEDTLVGETLVDGADVAGDDVDAPVVVAAAELAGADALFCDAHAASTTAAAMGVPHRAMRAARGSVRTGIVVFVIFVCACSNRGRMAELVRCAGAQPLVCGGDSGGDVCLAQFLSGHDGSS
jgi:hypothetical protein